MAAESFASRKRPLSGHSQNGTEFTQLTSMC